MSVVRAIPAILAAVLLGGLAVVPSAQAGGIPLERLLGEEPDPLLPVTPSDETTTQPAETVPDTTTPPRLSQSVSQPTGQSAVIDPAAPTGMDPARLAELTRMGRTVPVLQPETATDAPPAGLSIKEGDALINQRATITKDPNSHWMVAHLAGAATLDAQIQRRLLPNRLLGEIETVLTDRPNAIFRLSGDTFLFNKTPYLLIRRVTVLEESVPMASTETSSQSTPPALSTVTPPAEAATLPEGVDPGSAEAVMASMMHRAQPGQELRTPSVPEKTPEENVQSVAPAGRQPEQGPRRLVLDRIVRILPDEDDKSSWYIAHFESDNTLREPPMRILPNGMLSSALQIQTHLGQREIKFRVTGEITWYHGERYLLIRKLLRYRDMGQF